MSNIADRDWKYVWTCTDVGCGKRFHTIWRLYECYCPWCGRQNRLTEQLEGD